MKDLVSHPFKAQETWEKRGQIECKYRGEVDNTVQYYLLAVELLNSYLLWFIMQDVDNIVHFTDPQFPEDS